MNDLFTRIDMPTSSGAMYAANVQSTNYRMRVETVQILRKKKARETEEPVRMHWIVRTVLIQKCMRRVARGGPLDLIWIRGPLRGYGRQYKIHPVSFRRGDLLGSITTSLRLAKRGVYLENPIARGG